MLIGRCLAADPAKQAYYDGWGQRVYAFCQDLDPAILDLLGVRWIDAAGAAPRGPGLVERFRDGARALFENPSALPRAFLVGQSAVVVPDTAAAQTWLGSADRSTLASSAVVLAQDATGTLPTNPGSVGHASTIVSGSDRVDVTVSADRPALLVLTDVAVPDWSAEIDGGPVTLVPVDLAFRGVVVPAGDHTIVFRYRPVGTWIGFGLAGVALLATLLLAIWLARSRRDRDDPAVSPSPEARSGPS